MKYLKIIQFVPGKGDAAIYYECNEQDEIQRFVTHIPHTGEKERIENPVVKKLFRPEMCTTINKEEFDQNWD